MINTLIVNDVMSLRYLSYFELKRYRFLIVLFLFLLRLLELLLRSYLFLLLIIWLLHYLPRSQLLLYMASILDVEYIFLALLFLLW